MTRPAIIDALFSIPQKGPVVQISDCIPFLEDLTPRMKASGIAGAVLVHGNCTQCQYQWNCADRKTHEIANIVARHPRQLRGLAAYDPLRIGESLRWIDDAVSKGALAGTYVQAECCLTGLDAPRMYPLYGLCAKLRSPVVVNFSSRDRWAYHCPQIEVVAADFPDLEILLATPPRSEIAGIVGLMKHYPRISFLLGPQDLQQSELLCEFIELQGRDQVLFRSAAEEWPLAVQLASGVPLGPAAQRAYLSENASKMFGFAMETASLKIS
jgi:predicted TIM-barrel fold metal-dependent hydrolase